MTFHIALQFEDGVSRIIPCEPSELVADAAYRAKINIPLDCRDGVCGTCKSFCESGEYELGEYVEDEAMTAAEESEGYVLTCQMKPTSDCVIKVPASSAACSTRTGIAGNSGFSAASESIPTATSVQTAWRAEAERTRPSQRAVKAIASRPSERAETPAR